jgi:hypothetical protein
VVSNLFLGIRFISIHSLCLIGEITSRQLETPSTLGPLIYGFILLLLLFLLVNVDRRFREYVTRSLIRPFNFFADIRDQRLVPNPQTTLLGIILSGGIAMCFAAIIHLLFEVPQGQNTIKVRLPSSWQTGLFNLASDYMEMIAWLTLISFAIILLITTLLRFCAIFIRGRIMFGDTLNITIWSCLPLAFLLPLDLILPRMDVNETTLLLILAILFVLFLWIFFRLLKGTGVLFDIYPTRIYIYGTLILAVVLVALIIYLQQNHIFANFSSLCSVIRTTET